MPYDEFLKLLERFNHTPVSFAREIGYSDRSVGGWRRYGVPGWAVALLAAWEESRSQRQTIEFQRAAIREFNSTISDLRLHSREIVQ